MTSLKLSVILPAYNVECYIEKCIRSLINQGIPLSNYEIIVVNDGSPDNSRDVVIRLMKEFENLRLIDQPNSGVSIARNTGIEMAEGTYLLFVDPDDYVLPHTLSEAIEQALKMDLDVYLLGYTFLNVDGIAVSSLLYEQNAQIVYQGVEAYHLARVQYEVDPDRSVGILFRKEFLNRFSLSYLPGIPYLEDGEFLAKVFCMAIRCSFHGQPFYMRTTRPGSATNSSLFYSKKAIEGFILAAKNLNRVRQMQLLSDRQRTFLNQPLCKFILLTLTPLAKTRDITYLKNVVRRLKLAGMGRINLMGCNVFYRIEGNLYNLSPYMVVIHRWLGAPLIAVARIRHRYFTR